MKTPVVTTVLLALLTLAASFDAAGQTRTRATLLSLYSRSNAVMIGRYDKREEFGTNRVGNGYTAVTTKTTFDISSVLKGDPQKFVVVEDEEFRYQVQKDYEAPRDAVFISGGDPTDTGSLPKSGDTVLLFLKRDGDSFELVDDIDGVRKINPADQAVYEDLV